MLNKKAPRNNKKTISLYQLLHSVESPFQQQLLTDVFPPLKEFLNRWKMPNKHQDRLLLQLVYLFSINFDMRVYKFMKQSGCKEFLLGDNSQINTQNLIEYYVEFFSKMKPHFDRLLWQKKNISIYLVVDCLLLYNVHQNEPNFGDNLGKVCEFVGGITNDFATTTQKKYLKQANVAFSPSKIEKRSKILGGVLIDHVNHNYHNDHNNHNDCGNRDEDSTEDSYETPEKESTNEHKTNKRKTVTQSLPLKKRKVTKPTYTVHSVHSDKTVKSIPKNKLTLVYSQQSNSCVPLKKRMMTIIY